MTRREWRDLNEDELIQLVDEYIHALDMTTRPSISVANRRSNDEVPLKQLVSYLYRTHALQWSDILTRLGYPAQKRRPKRKLGEASADLEVEIAPVVGTPSGE